MFSYYNQKRFWSKVETKDINECWNFIGGLDKNKYGVFYLKGKSIKAHRYSFMLYNKVPKFCICHSCHNPSCVNPYHLRDATHQENIKEMLECGRSRSSLGENNTNTIIKDIEFIDIITQVINKKLKTFEEITNYNQKFSDKTIRRFINGKNWQHLKHNFTQKDLEFFRDTLFKYPTRELIQQIYKDTKQFNNVDLSKKYNLNVGTISRIKNKRHKYSK